MHERTFLTSDVSFSASPSPRPRREPVLGLSAPAKTSRACRSTPSARSMLSGNAADMSPDSSPLPAWPRRASFTV